MQQEKEVQHVYLVGAKSLGAYGGYETFVYKLTEYHQNKQKHYSHLQRARINGTLLIMMNLRDKLLQQLNKMKLMGL